MKNKKILVFCFLILVFLTYISFCFIRGYKEYQKGNSYLSSAQEIESKIKLSLIKISGPLNDPAIERISQSVVEELLQESILHYRRSLDWLVFFNPSVEKMLSIAQKYQVSGQLKISIFAYQELRSSFYSARGLWQPHENRIAEIDATLKKLQGVVVDLSTEPRHRSDNLIRSLWVFLTVISFWLWIIVTFLMILHGFTPEGIIKQKKIMPLTFFSLCFMFVWIFSLRMIP